MNTAAIRARKSVRTFTDQPVAPETIAELERFIASDANPFGVPVTFRILDREKYGLSSKSTPSSPSATRSKSSSCSPRRWAWERSGWPARSTARHSKRRWTWLQTR